MQSLSTIYRLFIDESDIMRKEEELKADDLYDAFTYLMEQLNDISKKVTFQYFNSSFIFKGYAQGIEIVTRDIF